MMVIPYPWVGQPLPEGYRSGVARVVTAEDVLKLFEQGFDVALMHNSEGLTILAIDERGRRFRQR